MREKRINSEEIARLAGVSRSTVSRVINNCKNVHPKTRERVLKIIGEYSYAPDFSAQMLAGKPSNTIGLFFASNRSSNQISAEDLLVNFMIERIIEIASDYDYFVLTKMIHDVHSEQNHMKIREMFVQRRIDGGIFVGFPNYYAPIEEMVASNYVVGIMDQNIPGRNETNRIIVNFDDDTMERAVEYLYQLGHRDIMVVLGDHRRFNGVQKEQAFYRAMDRLGLKVRKDWVLRGYFNRNIAYSEMEGFFRYRHSRMPTAVVCACDDMAYGVMDSLYEHGFRIPDDISVLGVDDSFMSRYTKPPLTTFRVDFEAMLKNLTENVIACIQKPFETPSRMTFGSTLVVRGSCRAINAGTAGIAGEEDSVTAEENIEVNIM